MSVQSQPVCALERLPNTVLLHVFSFKSSKKECPLLSKRINEILIKGWLQNMYSSIKEDYTTLFSHDGLTRLFLFDSARCEEQSARLEQILIDRRVFFKPKKEPQKLPVPIEQSKAPILPNPPVNSNETQAKAAIPSPSFISLQQFLKQWKNFNEFLKITSDNLFLRSTLLPTKIIADYYVENSFTSHSVLNIIKGIFQLDDQIRLDFRQFDSLASTHVQRQNDMIFTEFVDLLDPSYSNSLENTESLKSLKNDPQKIRKAFKEGLVRMKKDFDYDRFFNKLKAIPVEMLELSSFPKAALWKAFQKSLELGQVPFVKAFLNSKSDDFEDIEYCGLLKKSLSFYPLPSEGQIFFVRWYLDRLSQRLSTLSTQLTSLCGSTDKLQPATASAEQVVDPQAINSKEQAKERIHSLYFRAEDLLHYFACEASTSIIGSKALATTFLAHKMVNAEGKGNALNTLVDFSFKLSNSNFSIERQIALIEIFWADLTIPPDWRQSAFDTACRTAEKLSPENRSALMKIVSSVPEKTSGSSSAGGPAVLSVDNSTLLKK